MIGEATEVTPELVEAMGRLVGQLSRSAPAPTVDEIAEIVSSPASHLLVARDPNTDSIVGLVVLVLFRIPTGLRSWIEDVVVDEACRGQGVGEGLVEAAVRVASTAGARTIDLTSRPSRDAANRLYQRAGFELRDTNVYRRIVDTVDGGEGN